MSTTIQIRNVPDRLHTRLKACASLEGLSLSGYLLREIREIAGRPTLQEMARRLSARSAVKCTVSPAQILRQERNSR